MLQSALRKAGGKAYTLSKSRKGTGSSAGKREVGKKAYAIGGKGNCAESGGGVQGREIGELVRDLRGEMIRGNPLLDNMRRIGIKMQ